MNDPMKRLDCMLHGGGLAIVLSSACAAWCFVYRPLESARGAALARCDEISGLLESTDRLRAEQAELKHSLVEARQQEEALLARVPDDAREAEFLGQISRLAEDVGMELRDYRPGQVREQATCSAMEVALTCEGSYDAMCRFLDGLGRLPRLANLSRLDIDGSQSSGDYTALLKLVIYFGAGEKAASAERSSGPHG